MSIDLSKLPEGFTVDPYPYYKQLCSDTPVHAQVDGSVIVSSHAGLEQIFRDTKTYSSDKTLVFKPKYGETPLYEHHTTSLVFNDPPLHTRVRKIMVGALTPRSIAHLEAGLESLVDDLLDAVETELSMHQRCDLIEHFASRIPVNVIGNLFDMPMEDRGPLRDWSLAILGALEPVLTAEQLDAGNTAVLEFKHYLKQLVDDRIKSPGDPQTDVLTRLLFNDSGALSETELLHQCIFILNAGHETTTNLIGNTIALLHDHPDTRAKLNKYPEHIGTAIDEFLRFESPNQFGNRLTTCDCSLLGVELKAGTNLHLCLAAANRDERVFANAQTLDITRKPNRHFAFAGGPHSCIGLNLAKMEGRVAISKFLQRFPSFVIKQRSRSPRVRFRGFTQLSMSV